MRLTIAAKIILGFGIIIASVLTSVIFTIVTSNKSKTISNKITNIYIPSVTELKMVGTLITDSKVLISSWVFVPQSNTPDKLKLKSLHDNEWPQIKTTLSEVAENWETGEQDSLNYIIHSIDSLFGMHNGIMSSLNSFDRYDEADIVMEAQFMVEDGGDISSFSDMTMLKQNNLLTYFEKLTEDGRRDMDEGFASFANIVIILGIILVVIVLVIALTFVRMLIKPINDVKNILADMSQGIFPVLKKSTRGDEIGDMGRALNLLLDNLKKTANFSVEIGKGNYEHDFKPLSDKDILGNSLINMRKDLIDSADEREKQKIAEDQRNWTTHGLAKFAEILRKNNDSMSALSVDVISNLVKYLNVNQGGLFILNDDNKKDRFLEMTGCYAFDRTKFVDKKIRVGEGMVGTCFLEQQTIYMSDIPEDYMEITSGLGGSPPSCILIVPLKVNDEIYGVIELAAFDEIPKYKIEFVEKVGESIASTISSVKINVATASLLEQSQQQAEEMNAQEEEMRQNMEEMMATQEESARREAELRETMDAINKTQAVIEYDFNGFISGLNALATNIYGFTEMEVIGKHHSIMFDNKDVRESDNYRDFWEKMRKNQHFEGVVRRVNANKDYVIVKILAYPFFDNHGSPTKIMEMTTDITEIKEKEDLLERQKKKLSEQQNELAKKMGELDLVKRELDRKSLEQKDLEEALVEESKAQTEMLKMKLDATIKKLEKTQKELADLQNR